MDARLIKTLSILTVVMIITLSVAAISSPDSDVDAQTQGDMISYASTSEAVKLTFVEDLGSSINKTYTVRSGYPVQLPTQLFSKDGSYLSGWSDGSESFLPGADYIVNGDAVLTAEWTTPSNDRIRHLDDIVLQRNETLERFRLYDTSPDLSGNMTEITVPSWFSRVAGDYDDPYYIGSTGVPGVYLVSYYKAAIAGLHPTLCWYTITVPSDMDETYTVDFNLNGGSGSIPREYVTKGTGIILPDAESTSWAGDGSQSLVGWNITDADGNRGLFPLDSLYIFDADATVEAAWEGNPNVLVYSMDGGSLENVYTTVTWSDEPVSFRDDAVKSGYEFLGWKVAEDQAMVYAPKQLAYLDSTTKVEAYFVPTGTSLCTVTYDAGAGSTTLTSQKVESGKYVVLPMLQTSLPGYEFIGWSTDPPTGDGIDDRTPIGTEHLQIDSSITLYAVYHDAGTTDPDDPEPEEPEYSVTFDPNGGDTTYPVQKVTSGDKVSEPVSPLKDGCIFLGWAEVGKTEPYDFNRPVEYTMVLYAMWDEFFTISYAEDDEGAPVVIVTIAEDYRGADKIEVYWGSPLIQNTIVENGTAQMVYTYTTYGYIVLTATINGDQYTSRAPFSVSADHYNPTKVYTVYFNTDGGSYIEPQQVEHGKTIVKPVNPTKDGFNFNGWVGSNGAAWDFSTPIYAETTLRATWTDQPVVDDPEEVVAFFTITQTADGWTFDGAGSNNVTTWTWLVDDQEVGTGETFEFSSEGLSEGIHTVQLKVVGSDGKTYYSDKLNITKGQSETQPTYPIAHFTVKETESGWICDATTSVNAIKYEWYIDGQLLMGEYGRTLTIDADELQSGTHTVKLIVTSYTQNTDSHSESIVVESSEEPSEDDTDWMLIACVVIVIAGALIAVWRLWL